jgi:glycerol-3-phosphate cytidylyltransferase
MKKRVLVDMSLTILHHGHIRLLKKAFDLGYVIVALCRDEEILKAKGFKPLLSFDERKEIALAIRYVEDVIPCDYFIDEAYLDEHNIDILVHGDDNVNPIPSNRLVLFARTEGVSSTMLRENIPI